MSASPVAPPPSPVIGPLAPPKEADQSLYLHTDGWLRQDKPTDTKDAQEFRFTVQSCMFLPDQRGRVQYYRFEGFNLPKLDHKLSTFDGGKRRAWPGSAAFIMKLVWIQSTFAQVQRPKKQHSDCDTCKGKPVTEDPIHICSIHAPCVFCPDGKTPYSIATCQYAFDKYSWQHTYLHRIAEHGLIPSREFYEFVRDVDPEQVIKEAAKAVEEQMVPMSDEIMARAAAVQADLNPNQTVAGGGVVKELPRIVMPPSRYAGWANDEARAKATSDDFANKCKDTQWLSQRMKAPSKEFTDALKELKTNGLSALAAVARAKKQQSAQIRLAKKIQARKKDKDASVEAKAAELRKQATANSASPQPASRPYTKQEMLTELQTRDTPSE